MVAQCPISFAGIPFPYNFESFQILLLYLNLGIHLPDPWQNFILDLTLFLHVHTFFASLTTVWFSQRVTKILLRPNFEQVPPNFCRLFFPRKQSSSLLAFPEGCSREKLPSFPPDLPPPWNKNGAKNQNWTKNKICDQFFERKRPKIQNSCLWQKQKMR